MIAVDKFYLHVMVAAACCMLITGLILLIVKEPADKRASKYRSAKHALTVAVLVLGILNLVQVGLDGSGSVSHLGPCLALAVGYIQAMLFTMTTIVLINPKEVTSRRILAQLAAILLVDILLLGSFRLMPRQVFLYVYELGIVLYVLQLLLYTRLFLRSRKSFICQISHYYEEEEIERSFRWIYFLFWAALSVGVLSLLMLLNNRVVDAAITAALALIYALFAACFINYGFTAPIALPALFNESAGTDVGTDANVSVAERRNSQGYVSTEKLEQWIKDKGYLNTEKAVADIAAQNDMTVEQLQRYFRQVVGEEFRTWRVRRRIEEAKRIMAEHPEYSTTQIGKMSGFNDRSFFYQQFLRFTGISVATYRKQL